MATEIGDTVRQHQDILAGGLNEDGTHRVGLVHAVAQIVEQLALFEDRQDGFHSVVHGDGNGTDGLTIQVHDLQRGYKWVVYIAAIATGQLLLIGTYFVRAWFDNAGGG